MHINLAKRFHNDPRLREAADIIKSCVHCGFCTATCPTYQLLSDERDSPRGRIYLMKKLLEDAEVTERTRTHLDRCLTCRSCETTCPSGVQYGRLIDLVRAHMQETLPRSKTEAFKRQLLEQVLPKPERFVPLVSIGQMFKPLVPGKLGRKIPPRKKKTPWPMVRHERKMLVLESCGQSTASPNTNAAAARVLDHFGVSLQRAEEAGCCGAVSHHLGSHDDGLDYMRRNIDAWWPHIEQGCEAIVSTATGCGAMLAEYETLLKEDPAYREKAKRVSELSKDVSEVIHEIGLKRLPRAVKAERVAVHVPCSQQHALGLDRHVANILETVGYCLVKTTESHICCGSAGTYSILQPELSERLQERKLKALEIEKPQLIATSNIGCQMHLASGTDVPVLHWIELIDRNIVSGE